MDFAELWWCPGVPRSCHPIWQESRFANFTHLSSQLVSSFSKFLPMFLFPPFPLTTPETGSGSPPRFLGVQVVSLSDRRLKRNIRPLQKALPKAGRPEVGPGILGSRILPLPEIWFKGKWVGSIQLIETVVYVNRPVNRFFLLRGYGLWVGSIAILPPWIGESPPHKRVGKFSSQQGGGSKEGETPKKVWGRMKRLMFQSFMAMEKNISYQL